MDYGMTARSWGQVAEAGLFYWITRESTLLNWWISQATHRPELITTEGQRLIVLDPGRINDGPGPDIGSCHLLLDDLELSGDVEMHLEAKSWFAHGHQGDPAYDQVILHVVTFSGGGPDLATLVVPPGQLAGTVCPAKRPVDSGELMAMAVARFQQKCKHLQRLADTPHSPLLLGMLEVLWAGPARATHLQQAAVQLGLSAWPDVRPWQGSRQTHPLKQQLGQQLARLLTQADWFKPQFWQTFPQLNPRQQRTALGELSATGIARGQVTEWVINCLAPYLGGQAGFELWLSTPVSRHYGIENRLKSRLGLAHIRRVYEQQAVIQWSQQLCSAGNCQACPLIRYHQALGANN